MTILLIPNDFFLMISRYDRMWLKTRGMLHVRVMCHTIVGVLINLKTKASRVAAAVHFNVTAGAIPIESQKLKLAENVCSE